MRIRRLLALVGTGALLAGGLVAGLGSPAYASIIVVNTAGDGASACPATCTLRGAVAAANANAGDDQIQFTTNLPIVLSSGELVVNDPTGGSLTITGNGTANTVIDAGSASRVIDVTNATNALVLQNLTIQNGVAPAAGSGGGVLGATVTTSTVDFSSNVAATGSGGAISGNTVTVVGGHFDNNSAFAGGAINAAIVNISGNATFTRNHAAGNRGGAVSFDNTLAVDSSTFGGATTSQGNTSTVDGGAISTLSGSSLTLTRTTVINNSATVNGGGVFMDGNGTVTISNSAILSNTATDGEGGGIDMSGPNGTASQTLNVSQSVFQANMAPGGSPGAGGAIALLVSSATGSVTATITNNTFQGNTASHSGGVVDVSNGAGGTATVTLLHNTTTQNAAPSGAVENNVGGAVTVRANIFSANTGPSCSGPPPVDGGSNLVFNDGVGSACPIGGTNITGKDPLLGPLQVNPPGFTATMALGAGSPAIDAVQGACPPPAIDQRGVTRPQGAACDIGAFEVSVAVVTARFTG